MFSSQNSSFNYSLFFIIAILVFLGFLNTFLASIPFSLQKHGNSWHFGLHQLLFGLIPGIFLAVFFYKLNLNFLKKFSLLFLFLNIILLLLIFLPVIGVEIYGSRRWLKLGPILFQPSELLKITFLIYLSAWLSSKILKKRDLIQNSWQILFVFLIILILIGTILLAQPDFSTFFLILILGFLLYFLSSTPLWHLLILVSGGIIISIFLIITAPYRLARVLPIIHGKIDPLGIGYQLEQSLIAIGSGGLMGIEEGFSLGLSRQKFGFLPHSLTDSIFAIIGEEMGFIGCGIIVLLFIFLAWQGFKMAKKVSNEFNYLLVNGIIFWLVFQAFFNIAGNIGILPLAGIPLPFFSYGASHFLVEMIGIGILLNIGKRGQG